jgi:hypothetical protein
LKKYEIGFKSLETDKKNKLIKDFSILFTINSGHILTH